MEKINSIVIPRILDILNESPNTSEHIDNLYEILMDYIPKTVKKTVSNSDLDKAFDKALEVAENFGLIAMDEQTATLTFKFDKDGEETTLAPSQNLSNDVSYNSENDDEVYPESNKGATKMGKRRGRSTSSRRRRTRRSSRNDEQKLSRSRSRSTRRRRISKSRKESGRQEEKKTNSSRSGSSRGTRRNSRSGEE
ncbi:uncharacterized protein LOC142238926 [Haematobia irritans]|uniref:uncharacterized protein LOC142238926 n=1 Tax=Haematobia irritans TaxID=7368 RepID=UPI003F508C21